MLPKRGHGTLLGHLTVLLEANSVPSAWGQRPFPVYPVANELLFAQAPSKAPGGSGCSTAPFCALGKRKEHATTAPLIRLGQAFDLLLKMYELL